MGWRRVEHPPERVRARFMDKVYERPVVPCNTCRSRFDARQVRTPQPKLGKHESERSGCVRERDHDRGLVIVFVDLGIANVENNEPGCVVILVKHVFKKYVKSEGSTCARGCKCRNAWITQFGDLPHRSCRIGGGDGYDTESDESVFSLRERLGVRTHLPNIFKLRPWQAVECVAYFNEVLGDYREPYMISVTGEAVEHG